MNIYIPEPSPLGLSTTRAGIPTTTLFAGTVFVTTEFAPIFELLPTVIGPKTFAPAPIITLSDIVGCLFFFFQFCTP